ncbi:28S ribosomal protein S23, mitochondrial [Pseudolycoriella hygida]|uniref:Small ribosomal subunit protein mS23 n=1 Tax=Pseudolycoriella hygida TaxID=35572 RepID=A0A9Q0MU34_9DIPT|nr:28S ribosomal protein S23, mitochondrial [Pseudolycoriella hygida]
MASSRLEKIGTIFSRTTMLLRSGAMKLEDKPLWYDLYVAFPPQLEPRYDRPAPKMEIKQIFYEEDVIRAKYHKRVKNLGAVNLQDTNYQTQTQLFIEAYKHVKSQGALDEEQIIEVAQDIVRDKMKERSGSQKEPVGLVSSFTEATKESNRSTVDIKNIFE